MIGSICGQGVKGFKCGFIVWFGISVVWGVDRGVVAENFSLMDWSLVLIMDMIWVLLIAYLMVLVLENIWDNI